MAAQPRWPSTDCPQAPNHSGTSRQNLRRLLGSRGTGRARARSGGPGCEQLAARPRPRGCNHRGCREHRGDVAVGRQEVPGAGRATSSTKPSSSPMSSTMAQMPNRHRACRNPARPQDPRRRRISSAVTSSPPPEKSSFLTLSRMATSVRRSTRGPRWSRRGLGAASSSSVARPRRSNDHAPERPCLVDRPVQGEPQLDPVLVRHRRQRQDALRHRLQAAGQPGGGVASGLVVGVPRDGRRVDRRAVPVRELRADVDPGGACPSSGRLTWATM